VPTKHVRCDKLSNGLTVLRIDRPGWPVVTADVWVATGSASEVPAEAGISHFLEHMMFKGTERRAVGELDRLVEGVGGHWNAGTSKDFTHYYVTLPSDHRALAIDALADAVLRSVIDPAEVERERRVILEEWRRAEDNPPQVLFTRLYETAYAGGTYRWPVIGMRETIEAITRDQLGAYHRSRYRAETMTLILAGPVGDKEVLDEVAEHFRWDSKNGKAPAVASEVEWKTQGVTVVPKGVSEIYVALAWPAPSAEDRKAMVTMDVVQFLLGQGRASRLYQRLHDEERLVTTVSASYPAHRTTGLFMAMAACPPDKADAARDGLQREVRRMADEKPSAAEMARAKRLLITNHLFSRETTAGHTASVGYLHILTGSPDFDDEYIDLVSKVTAPAAAQAAAQFLASEPVATVAVQLPRCSHSPSRRCA
jgi:zinc protease